MSKKKDLIKENEQLKKDIVAVTTKLGKTPEEIKKDSDEIARLEREIAENKVLLEQAVEKEKTLRASILGGDKQVKVSDETFAKTKETLEGILNA